MKKIVVIGTGRMGGAFATAFVKRTSHEVSIRGSHAGSSSAAALSHQLGVRVADNKELLAADVVFVATPPAALDDVAAALKGYAGNIVSAMVPGAGGYELKRDDGTSAAEQLARGASYVDRILRGEKPADLPVQAPVKYQTIVNLKTAKLLGLEVPRIAACSRR